MTEETAQRLVDALNEHTQMMDQFIRTQQDAGSQMELASQTMRSAGSTMSSAASTISNSAVLMGRRY